MYGRVNENLTQEMIERSVLTESDIFSDIGSGIGQVIV
jgi:hypothetical protein